MKEDDTKPADEALEARIVAWVVGESSPFEAEELARLCAAEPELEAFRQRMISLHGLLAEASKADDDAEWKLSASRRNALAGIFDEAPVKMVPRRRWRIAPVITGIAATLAVGFVTLGYYRAGGPGGAVQEKAFVTAKFDQMSLPASRAVGLDAMEAAVREQEHKVEDRRRALSSFVRQKRAIITRGEESLSGADNAEDARAVADAYTRLQQEKTGIEKQIVNLLKSSGDELMVYASGLDLPENNMKTLYPEYLKEVQEYESAKNQGLGQDHPTIVEKVKRIESTKKDLDRSVVTLRETLQAQLALATARLERVEALRPERKDSAVVSGVETRDYVDAKRDFEKELELLQQMKLKLVTEKVNRKIEEGVVASNQPASIKPGVGIGFGSGLMAGEKKQKTAPTEKPSRRDRSIAGYRNQSEEANLMPQKQEASGRAFAEEKSMAPLSVETASPAPAAPAPPAMDVSNITAGGLRSGDQAMSLNSVDADRGSSAEVLDSISAVDPFVAPGGGGTPSPLPSDESDSRPAPGEMAPRQEMISDADRFFTEGREAYAKGDYQAAVEKFGKAKDTLPDASAPDDRNASYKGHFADASVALAQQYRKIGKYREARDLLDGVLSSDVDPGNAAAKQEVAYLDDPIRTNPALTYEHTQNVDPVRRGLHVAEGNFSLGKYDEAKREYENVLRIDRFNKAARRGLEQIAGAKNDYYRAAYDQTRAELLSQVDSAWELSVPAAPPANAVPAKDLKPVEAPQFDLGEIAARDEPFSTFSLSVSDVSFQLAKAAIAKGERPSPDQIKIEQFYNAVDYGDPAPSAGEPVAGVVEQSAHPVIPGRNLIRVAVRTASSGRAASQPLHLTLLIDQSGSMVREDRKAAMRKAMAELSALLTPNDRVSVIGFSRTATLLGDEVPGDQLGNITGAMNQEANEGGTNLEEAVMLASQIAARGKSPEAQNRIVLFTDGAANLGDADPARLAERIKALRQSGIAFDVAGIGADDLNDRLLAELARNGDGRYYVATDDFAKRLAGAFRPAAEDAKVQVRFNPERVARYKLIGFEENRLKKEDFRNDAVDAGELAAEDAAVALYQVELLPQGKGEIGEMSVRFRAAGTKETVERSWTIRYDEAAPAFDRSSFPMRLAGLSMLAAEKLMGGPAADRIDLRNFAAVSAEVRSYYKDSGRAADMLRLLDAIGR